jgi:hypothetical protein
MGHTVNLATVWGACATEKGRQFRQMSTDLSEYFPVIFCGEERVTGNGNVTGHKGRQGHAIKHFKNKYEFIAGIVVQKKSTNPGTPKVESRASPVY